MKIDLTEIYAKLEAWRDERGITAESQKEGYIINIMEEFGELAAALRDYERFSKPSYPYPKNKKYAEHGIIDALCDIAIFTINAGAGIAPNEIKTRNNWSLSFLLACINYFETSNFVAYADDVLICCASLCEKYGFNFEIAMLETIKEISSRTGSYDEKAKKWIKDESDEARAKWYSANYELARIKIPSL